MKKDGTLVAREMKILGNCGAYDMGGSLIARACSHEAVDTYRIPKFSWNSYCVCTNTGRRRLLCGVLAVGRFVGPWRAKGIAEATMVASAPAIANAIYDAILLG